ncbi:Mss4-like protein [Xylogone sp. PMI_703]|nr:Mss4-like protein [Xylogone sp. PMI_703]
MNVQCQCGTVKFKTPLPKPLALYICHCNECRKQSSSAFGCSAIFPFFPLPSKEFLSCYSRPTASGDMLNCYFCKVCGTRVIHSSPGHKVLSVKGGCIEGLDWTQAKHIWCKRAMVPIPEGVERSDEEPTESDDNLVEGLVF